MSQQIISLVNQPHMKDHPPQFRVGDTVNVHLKIKEGEKERIQVFNGVVIAVKGRGVGRSFTVRRIVANEGVERTFLIHSPFVTRVEVLRSGKVRRAKLYYLRDRVGKKRRLREKRVSQSARRNESAAPQAAADEEPADRAELAGVEG